MYTRDKSHPCKMTLFSVPTTRHAGVARERDESAAAAPRLFTWPRAIRDAGDDKPRRHAGAIALSREGLRLNNRDGVFYFRSMTADKIERGVRTRGRGQLWAQK